MFVPRSLTDLMPNIQLKSYVEAESTLLRQRLARTIKLSVNPYPRPKPIPSPASPPPKPPSRKRHTTALLKTPEWQALRQRVFQRDGRLCKQCGATDRLQIDHILPKATHPFLMFDIANLQVLCQPCNFSKQRKQRAM